MRVLLICPPRLSPVPDRLLGLLRPRREFRGFETVAFDRAVTRLRQGGFELVFVVVVGECGADALELVRAAHEAGGSRVLVVGPATDPKLILRAMQAGGERYLDQEELEADLDAALTSLCPSAGAGAKQLVAVLSAAGGCGASTVAANLAVVLAAAHGRCNLIDLNTTKADLAPLFDLRPQYTLTDLCRNEDRLDRTMYEKLLTAHPSGVALLAGPRFHEDALALTAFGVAQAVALARDTFAHVVVDLEDYFHDEQAAVLDQATRVLLVCRLDFTAVRNARRALDYLLARDIPRERIEVVVNHAGLPNELLVPDAEAALGVKLAHLIPHAPEAINRATNAGVPAAVEAPGSTVVQSIARLVGLDTPAPPGPDLRARAVSWLRARLNGRPTGPPPDLPLPQANVETKVCDEPVPAPKPYAVARRTCEV